MYKFLKGIRYRDISGWRYIILIACIGLIYLLTLRQSFLPALVFSCLPLLVLIFLNFLHRPLWFFYGLFILNYLVMGINRYIPVKGGLTMTIVTFLLLFIVLIQNLYTRAEWQRSRNLLVAFWGIWMIYCLGELFNPEALFEPWSISFPPYAFYPFIFAILVPLLFTRYRHVQWLLVIWGVLTLLAAAKGYWQKNRGFDATELDWLLNGGGRTTHLLHSGIRFFSFFTDAANFGSGMGLSLVTFGIAGFYVRRKWMKIFFWLVAAAGAYGLVISGTRSAIAVPFFGFALYIVLCRNLKAILLSGTFLLAAFIFLAYTDIGNENRLIRRMRTVLDPNDASWQVRVSNRAKLIEYMAVKPFGYGLGLGGGKAKRFRPEHPISHIATDSWLVEVWTETGIVGLIMYLTLIGAILFKGAQIATREIQHKELRGILLAMLAGICGLIASSYANEVLTYPNGIIVYTLMAFVFTARYYDKELCGNEEQQS